MKNLGKKFEEIVYSDMQKVEGVSIDRIPDQTMRYKGRTNVSDFIVYKMPVEYYIECKTVHGNRLPFSNISQFDKLLEKADIPGVQAGVLCWWVDKDVTRWMPIKSLEVMRKKGEKSVRYDDPGEFTNIAGVKKKVYFKYDFNSFFKEYEI